MKYLVIFISLILVFLAIRFGYFFTYQARVGDTVHFSATLFSDPKTLYGQQTFKAQGLTIYLPAKPKLHYGHTVQVKGRVEKKEVSSPTRARGSKQKREVIFVKMKKIRLVKTYTTDLLSLIYGMRQRFSATFYRYLPSQDAGLLLGIVFGIKDIDSDFYSQLQATGVLHIIAASGMNVTMTGGFILAVFGRFLRRQIALLFTIIVLIFYATLSGLDPSIVRATIMAVFAFGAQIFGRQNSSYLALFLAASGMIIYDPSLIQSVGFQLSVAATVGIVAIKPVLDRIGISSFQSPISNPPHPRPLPQEREKKRMILWDDFSTTLAAQIATLPIMIFTFGTYAPMSILVNLLVLWTVPYLMVLGGIAALISVITPVFSLPFLYFSFPLLFYFHQIINVFSNFSQPVEVGDVPVSLVIGYYCLLACAILLNKKQNIKN